MAGRVGGFEPPASWPQTGALATICSLHNRSAGWLRGQEPDKDSLSYIDMLHAILLTIELSRAIFVCVWHAYLKEERSYAESRRRIETATWVA